MIRGCLGAVLGALLAAALLPSVAAASERQVWIQSHPERGSKCIDVPYARFFPGIRVQIWDCIRIPSQTFSYNDQTHEMRIGGLCVQSWGRGDPGDPVGLDTCTGPPTQPNQYWQLRRDGEYDLIVGIFGRCLDLRNGVTANGAPIQVYPCKDGEKNQLWVLRDAAAPQAASGGGGRTSMPAEREQGDSVNVMFAKYDLLGTFAADCTKAPGKDNVFFVHRLIDSGHVQRDEMTGPTTRDHVSIIDKVSVEGPTVLAVSGTRDGVRFTVPWDVRDGAIQEIGWPGEQKSYKCRG